jgi:hypothetical protein
MLFKQDFPLDKRFCGINWLPLLDWFVFGDTILSIFRGLLLPFQKPTLKREGGGFEDLALFA